MSKKSKIVTIIVVALVTTGLVALSLLTLTKKPKVYRIGIVSGSENFADVADGFMAKMNELGYSEGVNVHYDVQKLNNDPDGEMRVVRKFVDDGADLIFAFPTGPALHAKAATQGTGIPVVFAQAGIEGNDLVESVQRPGGNITGMRASAAENTALRFEILLDLVPDAKRIYLVYDASYPNNGPSLDLIRPMAADHGVILVEDQVADMDGLNAALQARSLSGDIGVDAMMLMPDMINYSPDGFAVILEFANRHDLPLGGGAPITAEKGALFSFFPDNVEIGSQVAVMADKIFKGIPAGTISVGTPDERLLINMRAAQKLGLTVPNWLLGRADEIIN